MGKYDFTNLRQTIAQNEIPQEQVHNVAPTNPLLNNYTAPRAEVDRSSEYYKAGQAARKNALIDSLETARVKSVTPATSDPLEAKYITAKNNLDAAKNNLGYATDPMTEQQMRKELKMAQIAYDAVKKEYDSSKMKTADFITEEEASGQKAHEAPKSSDEIKTTPERDALIQEYSRIQNSNAIPAVRRREEIKARLNEIDQELGNGEMDHTFSDRSASVIGGSVKGFGADTANAAATAMMGLSELGKKLGGDTGEYAGWATDEVSRAAIPIENDSKAYDTQHKEVEAIQNASDRLAQSSAADINRAKNGQSGVAKFGTDIATNAIQMGMDGLASVLTGGAVNPLTSMFVRSAGGASREARQEGATTGQQIAYGAVRGGIEVVTEKLFDGLAGLYGKGGADEIVESVIGKMAKTNAGRTALRTFFNGVGEALEEGISGVTEPLTQAIYKGIDATKGYTKEHAAETLYSMLVGLAMGAGGGTVNILNGNNAQANAELAAAQVAQTLPTKGRTYEGVGQKAQNPEKAQQATQPIAQPVTQNYTQENTQGSTDQAGQNGSTTPPPNGNENTWSGNQVPTQSNFSNQLTEEERARPELNTENDTHIEHHDEEVDTNAQKRLFKVGQESARSDLLSRDPSGWDDVDVRAAQLILEAELEEARQLSGEEQDAAYQRIAQLKNAYNKQGTEAGRSLRQRQRFGGTNAEIVSEAANILYGEENKGQLRKLSPDQKTEIMQQIDEFSKKLENAPRGDTASIKDVIMQVAKIRNTSALLDFGQGKLSKVINAVANMEGGEDFLRQLATTQVRSIASDQIKASGWDKAKALRYMNMLSNPATASRNVGANTVFGNFIDAISSNMSSPIDALISLATGQRTIANERLSKEGLKGSLEAGLKSWLEVSLDAEAEYSTYAYNEIKGRTFKASGNFIERFLSALERNQGYQLKTTDQIAKGGIEAETKRNLMKKGVDAETAETLAKEEAKYRTLQNDSRLSKTAQGLRNLANYIGIPGKKGADGKRGKPRYGLGEDVLPFAQVPANVVQTELDLNPLSIFPALFRVTSVMADGLQGKPVSATEQRAAAKSVGRALNGTAIVASAVLMSAKGILRYTDDEDKDQKQLHKAQGKSGLQLNVSAAARLFSGQDCDERDGDKWISLGWIPQLNSLLIIGNMIYDDYKDMPEHKEFSDWAKLAGQSAVDSVQGIYKSILEFPAVSTITSMINAAKYANIPEGLSAEEERLARFGAAMADKVANTASSFLLPNALRATAAGLDDTERNLYTAGNRLGQAVDSFKAGIPDNPLIPRQYTRGSLPAQTDNFGNPITNEGGALQFLNKTVLPGAITTDKQTALLDEIDRVAMASGNPDAIPDKNGAYSVTYNGEKIKLTPEEREEYHQYAGKRSEEYIRSFMGSSLYRGMTDDQRAATMAKLNQQAKTEADKHYLDTHGKTGVDKLLDGKDAPGEPNDYTPLNKSNVATYYAYETMLKDAVEDGDYNTIDRLARQYGTLNKNLQTVLSERDDTGLTQILKWSDAGLGSETYYAFKDATIEAQKRMDKSSRTGSAVELDALAHMNIPEAEKRRIIDSIDGVGSKTVVGVYDILSDYGFTSQVINDFWQLSQDWTYKDSGDKETASKQGMLSNVEAAYTIEKLPGLTEAQRNDIYNRMKDVANVPYAPNDWKNYSYGSEVNYITSGRAKQAWGTSGNLTPDNPLYTGQAQAVDRRPNYIIKALNGLR